MNLLYDFEIKPDAYSRPESLPMFVLEEIRTMVHQRCSILNEEIDKEIASTAKRQIPITVLAIREGNLSIVHMKYSESLKAKLNDCVSADDMVYMCKKIAGNLFRQ